MYCFNTLHYKHVSRNAEAFFYGLLKLLCQTFTPVTLIKRQSGMPSTSLVLASDARSKPLINPQGVLADTPPFAGLPEAALKALATLGEVRLYDSGHDIYTHEQYDASEFVLIARGLLKRVAIAPDTGAMMVEHLKEGDFFGLAQATLGQTGSMSCFTLTAASDTIIIAFESDAFRELISHRPSLTRNLMQYFAYQFLCAQTPSDGPEMSPEGRVYSALMNYIEQEGVNGPWRAPFMPKHRELAQKADVDEATVAASIAMLIQNDIAERDYPGLKITDIKEMRSLIR